jgi:hypothetical protein
LIYLHVTEFEFDCAIVQFKGSTVDGAQKYIFSCQLEKFDVNKNSFCEKLGQFVTDAPNFCRQLSMMTKGNICTTEQIQSSPLSSSAHCISSESSSVRCISPEASSTHYILPDERQPRKRSHIEAESSTVKKRKVDSFQVERDRLQEQIPDYQIGTVAYFRKSGNKRARTPPLFHVSYCVFRSVVPKVEARGAFLVDHRAFD